MRAPNVAPDGPSAGWQRWRTLRSWLPFARRLPLGCIAIISAFLLLAVFAPLLAPHDPLTVDISQRLHPPALVGGDWSHVLGTDANGRDILSRIIYGARLDIPIAVISLGFGTVLGTAVGLVSGYARGWLDVVLMRITDLTLAFPIILLALLLAVSKGPSTTNVIVSIALILWARFARVVRGDVLAIRERDHIALARVAGASSSRIIFRHILPNVMSTIIILAALQMGWVILVEAALSFLGAGVPPPEPAWGSMIAEGQDYIATAWWVATMPGLAIMLAVLALNLFGDWLRDTLDPTLRQI
jgi:peptide/nickel transport system permease protein